MIECFSATTNTKRRIALIATISICSLFSLFQNYSWPFWLCDCFADAVRMSGRDKDLGHRCLRGFSHRHGE
eukprot:c32029_g1_i1 orf=128-340(+)